jgi:hypothetical protein
MHATFVRIAQPDSSAIVDQLANVLHAHCQMFGRLHQLLSHAIEDGRLKPNDIPDGYHAIAGTLAECAGPTAAAEALLDQLGMGKQVDVDYGHTDSYARYVKGVRDRSIANAAKAAFAYYLQAEGEEKANAAGIHENIVRAAQAAGIFAEMIGETPWAQN